MLLVVLKHLLLVALCIWIISAAIGFIPYYLCRDKEPSVRKSFATIAMVIANVVLVGILYFIMPHYNGESSAIFYTCTTSVVLLVLLTFFLLLPSIVAVIRMIKANKQAEKK